MAPSSKRPVSIKGHYNNGHWVDPYTQYRSAGRGRASPKIRHRSTVSRPSVSSNYPALAPHQPDSLQRPPRRSAPKSQPVTISPKAAEVAQEIVTKGWQSAVAGQLSIALGDSFWASVPRRQRKKPQCRALAALAKVIESAQKRTHDAIGAMANQGLGWLGRPLLERRIAEAFAKKISISGEHAIKPTVQALRIVGIWVCADAGLDVTTKCPCFFDLAKGLTNDALLKDVLSHKLYDLV